MKTLEEVKKMLNKHKSVLREKYGVKRIAVFGSYTRDEQGERSDVDIIVEFEKPIGLKFFELWDNLEEILGTKVDLLTLNALRQKPMLWEAVKEDMVYV